MYFVWQVQLVSSSLVSTLPQSRAGEENAWFVTAQPNKLLKVFLSFLLHFPQNKTTSKFVAFPSAAAAASVQWPSVNSAPDPAGEGVDVGVDARLVLLAAAVAPAHHAGDVEGSIVLAHQRSTRVALEGGKEKQRERFKANRDKFSRCDGGAVLWHTPPRHERRHTPGRSPRLPAGSLHRSCCRPATSRKQSVLCSGRRRWGRRERSTAGCCSALQEVEWTMPIRKIWQTELMIKTNKQNKKYWILTTCMEANTRVWVRIARWIPFYPIIPQIFPSIRVRRMEYFITYILDFITVFYIFL